MEAFFIGVLIGIIFLPLGLLVVMIDVWMKSDEYRKYKEEENERDKNDS